MTEAKKYSECVEPAEAGEQGKIGKVSGKMNQGQCLQHFTKIQVRCNRKITLIWAQRYKIPLKNKSCRGVTFSEAFSRQALGFLLPPGQWPAQQKRMLPETGRSGYSQPGNEWWG